MLRRWLFMAVLLVSSGLLLTSGGCAWFEQLKGPGFPGYDENGSKFRNKDPNNKPSGFLFDRRSEQIEQSLGGNF